ncbi:MAG: neutral zinc metallopeptidase [Bradymonadales bacterium]|nr:neutral zinc metallopeptidase [Bradymonadales bacterium]
MRWRTARRSANVDDRRGLSVGAKRGLQLGGGAAIVAIIIGLLTGTDISSLLQGVGGGVGGPATGEGQAPGTPRPDDELAEFVSVVLADTEDTWQPLFAEMGRRYEPPILVLFSDAVDSACGFTSSAVGPFYCSGDNKVYIDLSFYQDLHTRFGAPGDFAQAYVIAHEVGHHVQNQLGILGEVNSLRARSSQAEANALAIRLELQADCLAGVWGHHADRHRNLLEQGDVEEGLGAASAVGDDRIQRQAHGQITPETWTHGSSEQRVRWFTRGFESGRFDQCDTFHTNSL